MPSQLDCYRDWSARSSGDSWLWLTHSSCKNKPRHHPEQTFILLCPATSLHTHKWCLAYSHNDNQIPKRINPDGSVPWFRQLHFSSCLQPAWTPRFHCHGTHCHWQTLIMQWVVTELLWWHWTGFCSSLFQWQGNGQTGCFTGAQFFHRIC